MAPSDFPRPVSFDPSGSRRAFAVAGAALVALAETIPGEAWDRPGLGEWTVRDLLGHAGRSFVTVSEYLAAGVGRDVELSHPLDYAAVFGLAHADPAAITERGRAAGRALGEHPAAELRAQQEAAVAALERHRDDAPVATPAGVMRVGDYLPSRVFELVVHTDDLARALGVEHASSVEARAIACCFAAGIGAEARGDLDLLRAMTGRGTLPPGFTVL